MGSPLSDTDFYIVGQVDSTGPFYAGLWTKEKYTPFKQGLYGSLASAVTLNNGQVYSTGYLDGGYGFNRIFLWQNSVLDTIGSQAPVVNTGGTSVAISGSDVYVGGFYGDSSAYLVPAYWKNSVPVYLPKINPYDVSIVSGMAVSGTDVYAVGYDYHGYTLGVLWKNGVPTYLTDSTLNSVATAIQVVGNDVYIAGTIYKGPYSIAAYWKNGVLVQLSNGQSNAQASGILVDGSDVYVTGYINEQNPDAGPESPNQNQGMAVYWKNGVAIGLGTGWSDSEAYGIAIRKS